MIAFLMLALQTAAPQSPVAESLPTPTMATVTRAPTYDWTCSIDDVKGAKYTLELAIEGQKLARHVKISGAPHNSIPNGKARANSFAPSVLQLPGKKPILLEMFVLPDEFTLDLSWEGTTTSVLTVRRALRPFANGSCTLVGKTR